VAQVREIKRRIRSVQNTQQITKTMEMVSAAKIRRAQFRIEAARPYAAGMIDVLNNVGKRADVSLHPLLERHEPIKKTVIVVLSSDRGLCGAFNTNVIRMAENITAEEKQKNRVISIYATGRKAINYFKYVGYELIGEMREMSDSPTYEHAKKIANELIKLYIDKEIDKVVLVFNHFKSAMEQKGVKYVLLPIKEDTVASENPELSADYLFEPSDGEVLNHLLPTYIEALIYRALLESAASEHGARRTAMKSATDNAVDMIERLTRTFNRARQALITQEIAEIAGGAEALKAALQVGAEE